MIKDQTKITYREIMRRKFYERGLTLKDYKPQEILETILCDCITKQEDIPSIAEGLLLHFCSVKRILSADRQMLENTKLLDDSEITKLKIISETCREIRLSRFSFPLDITDMQMLNDFLEAVFDFTLNEKIFILPLNADGKVISIEFISLRATKKIKEIFEIIRKRMLKWKYKRFFLVHNCQGVFTEFSDIDREITSYVKYSSSMYGFEFVSHYAFTYSGTQEITANHSECEFYGRQYTWGEAVY